MVHKEALCLLLPASVRERITMLINHILGILEISDQENAKSYKIVKTPPRVTSVMPIIVSEELDSWLQPQVRAIIGGDFPSCSVKSVIKRHDKSSLSLKFWFSEDIVSDINLSFTSADYEVSEIEYYAEILLFSTVPDMLEELYTLLISNIQDISFNSHPSMFVLRKVEVLSNGHLSVLQGAYGADCLNVGPYNIWAPTIDLPQTIAIVKHCVSNLCTDDCCIRNNERLPLEAKLQNINNEGNGVISYTLQHAYIPHFAPKIFISEDWEKEERIDAALEIDGDRVGKVTTKDGVVEYQMAEKVPDIKRYQSHLNLMQAAQSTAKQTVAEFRTETFVKTTKNFNKSDVTATITKYEDSLKTTNKLKTPAANVKIPLTSTVRAAGGKVVTTGPAAGPTLGNNPLSAIRRPQRQLYANDQSIMLSGRKADTVAPRATVPAPLGIVAPAAAPPPASAASVTKHVSFGANVQQRSITQQSSLADNQTGQAPAATNANVEPPVVDLYSDNGDEENEGSLGSLISQTNKSDDDIAHIQLPEFADGVPMDTRQLESCLEAGNRPARQATSVYQTASAVLENLSRLSLKNQPWSEEAEEAAKKLNDILKDLNQSRINMSLGDQTAQDDSAFNDAKEELTNLNASTPKRTEPDRAAEIDARARLMTVEARDLAAKGQVSPELSKSAPAATNVDKDDDVIVDDPDDIVLSTSLGMDRTLTSASVNARRASMTAPTTAKNLNDELAEVEDTKQSEKE